MKRSKSICFILLFAVSILSAHCDIKKENDRKEKQNMMLLLLVGGTGNNCNASESSGEVTIDGDERTAYEIGGVPQVAAHYDSENNFTVITMCLASSCSEEILIFTPGHTEGVFDNHSASTNKVIIYANGAPWSSDEALGGSGSIEITSYGSCFVEGTFNGTVAYPAQPSHELTLGSFKAVLD